MANAKIIAPSSELYTRAFEYIPEITINVNKLENEEQLRRVADKEGENHKRVLANNMSVLFGENTRETWFHLGSNFVLNLLGSVRQAVQNNASVVSATVASKAGVAKQSAQEVALNIKNKGVEGAHNLAQGLQDKGHIIAQGLQDKGHILAQDLQDKGHNLAQGLQDKGINLAQDIQEKGVKTAHDISSFAQEKTSETKSFLSNKVFEFSHKLKDAVSMSYYKTLGSFGGHSNLTYALMLQEAERTRRMNSSDEVFAIKNSMKVASLIKELPALYRPQSEPYSLYSAKLVEEAERVRRIVEIENNDKAGFANAKAVSSLISEKFNVQTQPISLPVVQEAKVEVHEPQQKSAFTAAM